MSLKTIIKEYGAENISFALLKRALGKFENILEHNLDSYFHPASLLKLFISLMVSECSQRTDPLTVKRTEYEKKELSRAIHESISASDNDALAFLIDYLTGQQSQDILTEIFNSRLQINKFFLEKGFSEKINLANKCFSFNYYGKERQIYEALGHNQINNRDLIKLLILIDKSFPFILNSMKRTLKKQKDNNDTITEYLNSQYHNIPSNIIDTEDYQVQAFSGQVITRKFQIDNIYSKAGWNSKVRHDAVFFSIPEEHETVSPPQYILTVLTKNLSYDEKILQRIVTEILLTLKQ
jgi:hypothetical protein